MKHRSDDFTVDHLAYLTDRRHRRAVHGVSRRLGRRRGVISEVRILHEADGRCCRLQSWSETAAAIVMALSRDGERVAWLLPDRLVVGNPDGERDAEELRDRLRRLAGGRATEPPPTVLAVRDRMLDRWYAAGGMRCLHPVVAPAVDTLMPWSPELARCAACWQEHDRLHMPADEDQHCDICGHVSEDQLGFVAGPWFGILYVIAACPDCMERIQLEVAA